MSNVRNYALVTASYWGFTLTDGALRMLVLLYFHTLGYTPFEVASLFLLYEFFGIVTNLVGGWLGARFGLRVTLFGGLAIQIGALIMLAQVTPDWVQWISVAYVCVAQAFCGIAKDLTKMSSKSAIKLVVPENTGGRLYKWVALLTGSKNALKGVGFFMGAALLETIGFAVALYAMAAGLSVVLVGSVLTLPGSMGQLKEKVKFTQVFSTSRAVNMLSAARFFLFGSRDVWFVVGLPVFLYDVLEWSFTEVGGYLAFWVIAYGIVQSTTPQLTKGTRLGTHPDGKDAVWLAFLLAAVPAGLALGLHYNVDPTLLIIVGLAVFGVIFAFNSAVHSFLILDYSDADGVSMNVGFYYMANAMGRLVGTVLSGWLYQVWGLEGCLWASVGLVIAASALSLALPRKLATA